MRFSRLLLRLERGLGHRWLLLEARQRRRLRGEIRDWDWPRVGCCGCAAHRRWAARPRAGDGWRDVAREGGRDQVAMVLSSRLGMNCWGLDEEVSE